MATTLLQKNRRNKHGELITFIWGTLYARGIRLDEFCEGAKIKKSTMYNRKATPEDFTLSEISRIGKYLDIPIDELRKQCVRY